MWTAHPLWELARTALRQRRLAVRQLATRTWQIAPGEEAVSPKAHFLPGQLERVTGWTFADEHPRRQMLGGYNNQHAPTSAYLLQDAVLFDGRLFKGGACEHLHARTTLAPIVRIDNEIERAAIYSTAPGNRYFGQWLMDDCNAYLLACDDGVPLSVAREDWAHKTQYETCFDMKPLRQSRALIREAVIFDDFGQNANKRARVRQMRERLLSKVKPKPHPGVFILRGSSGDRRILLNEMEIAEGLRRSRGFKVIDPMQMSVPDILAACAGAETVVGVEGSGLMHGIIVLPEGGRLLTLQPPNRFVGLYKHLTDRDGQHFGFVVGTPSGQDFTIDVDEVERTLDLLPAVAPV